MANAIKTKHCFVFVGPTGCGKTYTAFKRRNKHVKCLYLAPCRQLVYETAQKYGNIGCHIKTSDMEEGDATVAPISFRTYESAKEGEIKNYGLVIIDEAHFINDKERGFHLLNIIYNAEKNGVKTVLLSATMDFSIAGAKIISLPARGKEFIKEEVSYEEALERARIGVPTLIFHRRRDDCGGIGQALGLKYAAITAETSVADRVRLIKLFNEGKITLIESTNALAQGVNVPCENLIVFYNKYDDPEVVIQKFGRLGRTGVTRADAKLTYFCERRNKNDIEEMSKHFCSPEKEIKIEKSRGRKVKDFDLRTPATPDQVANLVRKIRKEWSR